MGAKPEWLGQSSEGPVYHWENAYFRTFRSERVRAKVMVKRIYLEEDLPKMNTDFC